MTTDVHAHVLLPALQDAVEARAPEQFAAAQQLEARRNGPASLAASGAMIRERFGRLTDLGARLAAMDAQQVDRQWVSASPSHFYPWADEHLAVWIAAEANRLVAEHVAGAPDRLTGLGVVPLQHPARTVEALDDAVLGHGLAGVEISSFAGDVELSDERLEPFWARAEELGAIVFLHPFGCSLDERLDRFYLSNTVGQPVENAVALSHLIFSGVLDRHPGLRIVAAHGGGYLPTAIGRSDHAWRVRPEAHGCLNEPSSYLRHIWFDTVVHDAAGLAHLVEVAGASQVVLGSDFPFDMGSEDPVAFVRSAGLDDEVLQRVLAGNAEQLLAGQAQAQAQSKVQSQSQSHSQGAGVAP
ncbi:amidohydrolase [Subtercola sp. Z020]|uniref:amidohydrolase family protein n=1 Tax=Subtercola sp. Z020 TaxID=2080582 RepID=UPI000CE76844|nr:amidohydrolase family protein [Subtercola sp. Z020]PPF89610.1 amidohydrolase [Subtercola sp. Z020]